MDPDVFGCLNGYCKSVLHYRGGHGPQWRSWQEARYRRTFTVRGLGRPCPLWLRLVEPMTFGMRDSVVVVLVHIFQWLTF